MFRHISPCESEVVSFSYISCTFWVILGDSYTFWVTMSFEMYGKCTTFSYGRTLGRTDYDIFLHTLTKFHLNIQSQKRRTKSIWWGFSKWTNLLFEDHNCGDTNPRACEPYKMHPNRNLAPIDRPICMTQDQPQLATLPSHPPPPRLPMHPEYRKCQ